MEAGRRPPRLPNWLYLAIVASLGIYFVIGGATWAMIAYQGRDVPDSFATVLATIAGGLVGILTQSGGASGSSGDS